MSGIKIIPLSCKKAVTRDAIERYPGIQIIDSRIIAGRSHITFAISKAEKAFEKGENISKDFFLEVLLRASAQRQIKEAVSLLGIKEEGLKGIILLCKEVPQDFLEEYGCREDPEIFNIGKDKYERIKEAFFIDETEIRAVSGPGIKSRTDLLKAIVKERISLLEV